MRFRAMPVAVLSYLHGLLWWRSGVEGRGSMLTKLNHAHMLMAMMVAAGKSTRDIAEKLGYAVSTVETLRRSELFQAQVSQIMKEMREATIGTLLDRIETESMPSLDVILAVRDGVFQDVQTGRLQFDAAKFVLADLHMDRRIPKVVKQENEAVVRVTFNGNVLRQMFSALAEDRGEVIDVGESPPVRLLIPKDPPAVAVQSIDDALAEMEAGESKEESDEVS